MTLTTIEAKKRADTRPTSTTEAILDAAKALFLAEGFDGVNLDRIARRAAVSRQTLYNQFGSKEAVFRAMAERHWAIFTNERLFASPDVADGAATVLRSLAGLIMRFIREDDQVAFTQLVIAESRHLPWMAEEFYRLGKRPLLIGFAGSLARLTEAGHLRCPDPALAAHQFLGLVQELVFWPHVMRIGPDAEALPEPDHTIAQAIETFLCRYGVPDRGTPGPAISGQAPASRGRQACAAGTVSKTR